MSSAKLASLSEGDPQVGATWLDGLRPDPDLTVAEWAGRSMSVARRHGEADAPLMAVMDGPTTLAFLRWAVAAARDVNDPDE